MLPLAGGALLLTLIAGGMAYRVRRSGSGPRGVDAASGSPTDSEPAPVTDDERIVQILESNGGRMKQNDIVDAVDWSKSKVSRVTGKLADEGVIRETQIGRENVLELDREQADS
jgi:uncharacterized membrane protein